MNLFPKRLVSAASAAFVALRASYDAAQASKRRTQRKIDLRREDEVLKQKDRDKVNSDARDLNRNSPDVGWMIRKHCDYVSTFSFRSTNTEPDLATWTNAAGVSVTLPVADAIQKLIAERMQKQFADITGRFTLDELFRMVEAQTITDNDTLVYKLFGGKIQVVEGDRVRTPTDMGDVKGYKPEDFTNGVILNEDGKPLKYAICERLKGGGYKLLEVVPARYIYHHGHWTRTDQARPVSPLVSAINNWTDVYESREFALAKMKVQQLFGLQIMRGQTTDPDEGTDGDVQIDLNGGPVVLDMENGDKAEFMTADSPGGDFRAFFQTGIMIGLKALDIPYSFWDEGYTNYSGQRTGWIQYDESCNHKRVRNRGMRDDWTLWQIRVAIFDERLVLPAGWTIERLTWEWVNRGVPWIDPLKDIQADKIAVDNYQTSPQRVCKGRGEDFFDIVDECAEARDYLATKKLPPPVAWAAGVPINEVPPQQEQPNAQA